MYRSQQSTEVSSSPNVDQAPVADGQTTVAGGESVKSDSATGDSASGDAKPTQSADAVTEATAAQTPAVQTPAVEAPVADVAAAKTTAGTSTDAAAKAVVTGKPAGESPASTSNASKSTATTSTSTASPEAAKPKEAEPMSTAAQLLIWLPFVVAMGLWLYLRGRNQAAERARAEALAASVKKQKKSSRLQSDVVGANDSTGSVIQESGSRTKGNSKKNKKDKQKKQQQTAAAQSSKKVSSANAATVKPAVSASSIATALSAVKSEAKSDAELKSTSVQANALQATSPKAEPAAPQVNKAIFEPLRKVTAKVTSATEVDEAEGDEAEDYRGRDYNSDRNSGRNSDRQRRSNEPTIVTTPAKVSGTRFEKLNVPAANAGLGSATNRWPAEATRPVAPAQPTAAFQPSRDSRSDASASSASSSGNSSATMSSPQMARGLSAFLKKASSAETSSESDANPPSADKTGN